MAGETACLPVIVTLPNEIDITNSAIAGACLLGALDNPGLVIADMTGTTFSDTSGLRVLLAARDRAQASGCTLRIAISPRGSVARAMSILGLDRVLPIYFSVLDAMTAHEDATRSAS